MLPGPQGVTQTQTRIAETCFLAVARTGGYLLTTTGAACPPLFTTDTGQQAMWPAALPCSLWQWLNGCLLPAGQV